ncbi:hypothetical protein [Kordia zhangzhouensis]|uniref:hypothetical protein n=1 Tax=Kordia zhangzhouensis TaxID=1620405 RepID=UPI0012F7C65B|nr:hypothetical protein [Kordia zhangzhouensis]
MKLEVRKVSVSRLNNIVGGNDPQPSIDDVCIITTIRVTILGADCKTGITLSNDTEEFCIDASVDKC